MINVYRHRRNDNFQPFYIGVSKNASRPYSKKNRNTDWHNTVKDTGYSVEILTKVDSWEDGYALEKLLISEYGRRDLGTGILVNQTNGGGSKSQDTVNKGQIPWNKGKVMSDEYCKAMSKAQSGKTLSEEHKKAISLSGKKLNRKVSEEAKLHLSVVQGRPVLQYDLDGVYITRFWGVNEAGRKLKINAGNIASVCRGERKSAGGFKFGYLFNYKK